MRLALIYLIITVGTFSLSAQNVQWDIDTYNIWHMDVSQNGNIGALGPIATTLTFPTDTFVPGLMPNSYVASYDSTGQFLWVKHIYSVGLVIPSLVKFDHEGNLIVSVASGHPSMILPDSIPHPKGILLLKIDPLGNLIWSKWLAEKGDALSIAIDQDNNIYLTGKFSEQFVANDTLVTNGGPSGFLAKIDKFGNGVWAREFEGYDYLPPITVPFLTSVNGVSVDGSKLIVVGQYTDILKTPIDSIIGPNTNEFKLFLSGLDTSGNFQWIEFITSGEHFIYEETTNTVSGDIIFAGECNNPFVLGSDTVAMPGQYVARLDINGDLVWGNDITDLNALNSHPVSMDVSSNGTLYLTGSFNDTANFHGNVLNSQLSDVFLVMFDSTGSFKGINHGYSSYYDYSYSVRAGNNNSIFMANYHGANFNFGNYNNANGSSRILKLTPSLLTINERENLSTLNLYPNPTQSLLTFEDINMEAGMPIQIVDFMGRIVKQDITSGPSTQLDVSDLPKGVYVINIEGKTFIGKFMKW